MPDDLPPWFLRLRERYLAGAASVFAVDAPPGAEVAAPGSAMAPLLESVTACLSASRDHVYVHDLLRGLRGLGPAARAHRQELPAEPLEALRRLLAQPGGSAAVILAHADLTLPAGPGASDSQRAAELWLREALDSAALRRSDHVVVLTLPSAARLPPALAAHPRLLRLSAHPPPGESGVAQGTQPYEEPPSVAPPRTPEP